MSTIHKMHSIAYFYIFLNYHSNELSIIITSYAIYIVNYIFKLHHDIQTIKIKISPNITSYPNYPKITNPFQMQQTNENVPNTTLYVLPDIAYQDLGTVMILLTVQTVLMNITAVRYKKAGLDSAWGSRRKLLIIAITIKNHFQHSMYGEFTSSLIGSRP